MIYKCFLFAGINYQLLVKKKLAMYTGLGAASIDYITHKVRSLITLILAKYSRPIRCRAKLCGTGSTFKRWRVNYFNESVLKLSQCVTSAKSWNSDGL